MRQASAYFLKLSERLRALKNSPMGIEAKDRLARAGDWSDKAAGFRLEAAIRATGLAKTAFAERSGQQLTAIINSTKGRSHPSKQSMRALYRFFRIDPTFIMFGDYGQLPADVQDRIFAELEALTSEQDPPSDLR